MVSHETKLLTVNHATKRYGETVALHDVSLSIHRGEVLSLLGPSGSGKSTLLRLIAGLVTPDSGTVRLRDREITTMPPHERGFGMMFQQFALFPHRTVGENIAFGLEMQGRSRAERNARVEEMLALVGMSGYDNRSIFELSGGEQQRVALARSLAPKPSLILLDEPLGSLDRRLRERLVEELRAILSRVETTAIYVTHDQQEAFAISDRLALMNAGRVVQIGTAETLYKRPNNRFVADFFGLSNILPILAISPLVEGSSAVVETALGRFILAPPQAPTAWLVIRPEAARLAASAGGMNHIRGRVVSWTFRGSHHRLVTHHAAVGDLEWEIYQAEAEKIAVGDAVGLSIETDGIAFIPEQGL
ncbi:MAG: ABC transporter ATP-binding protein [Ardenticatenales bacterium]|nr:ABC transporter ATP-binding protein [Ardenticatenales bacterium]